MGDCNPRSSGARQHDRGIDFASPVAGLGSKLGLDATNKWPGETTREWGRPITLDPAVERRVETLWKKVFGVG